MLHTTLRNLFARKIRLLLSALAVVVGVSFVTGTLVLTDTLNRTFDTLFANITKNVSVSVRAINAVDDGSGGNSPGRPVPASLLDSVKGVPGVRAAVGKVDGTAVFVNPRTGKVLDTGGAPGIGTSWDGGTPVSAVGIATGRAPQGSEIVVDKGSADKANLLIGDRVTVLTKGAPAVYTLVGTFRLAGQDSVGGVTVIAFDTATAQRVLLAPGQFTSIKIAAADGLSQTELRDRVAGVLPAGVEAITGKQLADENANAVQKAIGGFSTFLLVFAGISVFVGAFIIFNTFTMLVAQRVRELALLRALGASRRQVQLSVQLEACIVGFVGATVGLVLGAALALLLRVVVTAIGVSLPGGGLVFQPRTIIVAYAVGVVITAVAAFIPARKAASVPPVAAMRETFVLPTRSLRTRGIAGGALTVIGALLLVYGLTTVTGKSGAAVVGIGAGLCFLGIATLSPLLARPVTRFIGSPLPILFGATGRLGRENAMRNPRRSASTASALMIGLALVSAFSVLGASIKQSVKETVRNSLGADFYLSGSGFGQGFSPEIARSLQGKPGIDLVTGLRSDIAEVKGKKGTLLAGDPVALPQLLALQQMNGDLGKLGNGTIIMDSDTVTAEGLVVGQQVPVVFPDGPTTLTLAGTYKKSQVAGKYLVSLSEFSRHYNSGLDMFVMVRTAPNADLSQVRKEIDSVAQAYPNVQVRDQSQFVRQQEKQVDQLLGFVYVLLALAVVIALFGIVNTLALSVIERTREIGLLRAVGMSRRQLRRMVRLEAVVIAVFGAVLGVVVGSFFGWALTLALKEQGINSFAYPVGTVIVVVIVGALLGVLAAIFPARRAARMDILRAIATT
ncbi:FtsX-like permease family protein [Frankia sp. Cppng1_Ct_nod]|uniref:ABC transporter permease n=1 Tax=Frankia sp. Cppng1_Ct_nod TaxID=2897162 RepID=UPI0010411D47|nr:FtsX-like permease family protein [Frankia sp. Cppng1_Ct_nod]